MLGPLSLMFEPLWHLVVMAMKAAVAGYAIDLHPEMVFGTRMLHT